MVTTAAQRRSDEPANDTGQTLITLSANEFRRLFTILLLRPLRAFADIMA
jgi:hypothetical protein